MPIQLVADEVEIWNRALARVGDNRLKLEQIIHVFNGNVSADPIIITTIGVNTFVDGDVNVGNEQITVTSHGYATGQGPIRLSTTGTLPTGLALSTDYFIIRVDSNTIQLTLTQLGPAVDITAAAGGGTHTITPPVSGYLDDDLVLVDGMADLTSINGRVFKINVLDAFMFQLLDATAASDDSQEGAPSPGIIRRIQNSGNKNAQACFAAWAIDRDEVFYAHPWNGVVKRDRVARLGDSFALGNATQTNPVRITVTGGPHTYEDGDVVNITSMPSNSMIEINNRWFTIINSGTDPNAFDLSGEDGTEHSAFVVGGGGQDGVVTVADNPFRADSGFRNRYLLPDDNLRILELVDSDSLWMVENGELHTNDGKSVPIRYIFRQLDVTTYGPNLVSTLAYRLALDIVEELTQSNTKRDKALQEFDIFLRRSARSDGQEQSAMPFAEDEWIQARATTGRFDRLRDRFSST